MPLADRSQQLDLRRGALPLLVHGRPGVRPGDDQPLVRLGRGAGPGLGRLATGLGEDLLGGAGHVAHRSNERPVLLGEAGVLFGEPADLGLQPIDLRVALLGLELPDDPSAGASTTALRERCLLSSR